jgi:hypothetical protein
MSLEDFGIAVGIFSTVVTMIIAFVAFGIRFALVPFLEKRWSGPVDEMIGNLREMKAEIIVISRAFDGHLDWSQREVDQIWSAINRRNRNEKPNPRRADDRPDRPN